MIGRAAEETHHQPDRPRRGSGILAIWNDCAAGEEAALERWYLNEHLAERVGIEGFHWGRRYRAMGRGPRFMTLYQTETPDVLSSPAYLNRVNAPSPETARIMKDAFRNMSRTVCLLAAQSGAIRGCYVVVARFPSAGLPTLADLPLPLYPLMNREIWLNVEPAGAPVSAEEALRGPDSKIAGAILADTQTEGEAWTLAGEMAGRWTEADIAAYALLNTLSAADLR